MIHPTSIFFQIYMHNDGVCVCVCVGGGGGGGVFITELFYAFISPPCFPALYSAIPTSCYTFNASFILLYCLS